MFTSIEKINNQITRQVKMVNLKPIEYLIYGIISRITYKTRVPKIITFKNIQDTLKKQNQKEISERQIKYIINKLTKNGLIEKWTTTHADKKLGFGYWKRSNYYRIA